ncbi:hypothetical protein [Streptomyces vinaceus]|uniref:hypothetical protein n=1 Tax=Streptomyces vinaceus TaxID=1960 RepID=UPI003685343A
MAGTEFGHALGRSRALSGLPAAPLVARYGELASAQQALGLRHLGDLLVPGGGHFRVLDGIFSVEGPGRRRHVGAQALRELRAGHADAEGGAGALLERLAGIQERDPAALRRILLYQLVRLLHEHPRGDLPDTAVGFGVDPDEAAALVHAAGASPRLDAAGRAAAERLEDEWLAGRVRAAARSAAALPRSAAGGDPLLAGRLAGLAERVRAADALLDEARGHEERPDRERAAAAYGRAARVAWDCPRAVRGLIRTHRPADGDPGPLEASPVPGGVALRRPAGADPDGIWRVVRLTRREPVTTPLPEVPGPLGAGPLTDRRAPLGREVRYVALPGDGGTPLISAPLLVAPEVTDLRLTDGRSRVGATWLRPPGATGVRVALTDPEGRTRDLGAPTAAEAADPADAADAADAGSAGPGREGVRADGLGAGEYLLRVRCSYAGAGGEVVSGGVGAAVTVHPWPEPVTGLGARARGAGGLELRWSGGDGGDVRFVQWPEPAPAEGAELVASALPPALTWVDAAGIAQPPRGRAGPRPRPRRPARGGAAASVVYTPQGRPRRARVPTPLPEVPGPLGAGPLTVRRARWPPSAPCRCSASGRWPGRACPSRPPRRSPGSRSGGPPAAGPRSASTGPTARAGSWSPSPPTPAASAPNTPSRGPFSCARDWNCPSDRARSASPRTPRRAARTRSRPPRAAPGRPSSRPTWPSRTGSCPAPGGCCGAAPPCCG